MYRMKYCVEIFGVSPKLDSTPAKLNETGVSSALVQKPEDVIVSQTPVSPSDAKRLRNCHLSC